MRTNPVRRALSLVVTLAAVGGCGFGPEEYGADQAEVVVELERGPSIEARIQESSVDAEIAPAQRSFASLGAVPIGPNLIINPSFESKRDGMLIAWFADSGIAELSNIAHSGSHSAMLASSTPTDIAWHQLIDYLIIQRTYVLCGWIKGHDVVPRGDGSVGASIAASTGAGVFQADAGSGTFGWTEVCASFTAVTNFVDIMCRLGGPNSPASGTMWCDDISLHELAPAL